MLKYLKRKINGIDNDEDKNIIKKEKKQDKTEKKEENKVQRRGKKLNLGGEVAFKKFFKETGSWVIYIPDFVQKINLDDTKLMDDFLESVNWIDEKSFYGNPPNRKKAWYGYYPYKYSGTHNPTNKNFPLGMKSLVKLIQDRVNLEIKNMRIKNGIGDHDCDCEYASVLANLYSTGSNSIGWHSDNEEDLYLNSPICSLSLGTTRIFKLRALRTKEHLAMDEFPSLMNITLLSGSLLIMGGTCQKHWQHTIEKEEDVENPRISLTTRMHKTYRLSESEKLEFLSH